MSSRVALILRSVSIALLESSLRLCLHSIRARSLQRWFSKSCSRSKVIATSASVSPREFSAGTQSRTQTNVVVCIAGNLFPSLCLVVISSMVTIDHIGRDSAHLYSERCLDAPLRLAAPHRGPVVALRGGERGRDIDHFPYFQEKFVGQHGFHQ